MELHLLTLKKFLLPNLSRENPSRYCLRSKMRQTHRELSRWSAITDCSQIDRKVQQGNKNARTGLISFTAGCAQDGRSDCSSRSPDWNWIKQDGRSITWRCFTRVCTRLTGVRHVHRYVVHTGRPINDDRCYPCAHADNLWEVDPIFARCSRCELSAHAIKVRPFCKLLLIYILQFLYADIFIG